jgi:hypothetical protein
MGSTSSIPRTVPVKIKKNQNCQTKMKLVRIRHAIMTGVFLAGGMKLFAQVPPAESTNHFYFLSFATNGPGAEAVRTTNSPSDTESNGIIPLIRFSGVPLSIGIMHLANAAGINCILRPDLVFIIKGKWAVRDPEVTLHWENLPLREGFDRLLKRYGLIAIDNPDTSIFVITREGQRLHAVDTTLLGPNTNGIQSLIKFDEVPLDIVLKDLARKAGLNLSVQVGPSPLHSSWFESPPPTCPKVSVCWKNVTAPQAIAALCENNDLVIRKSPTNVIIQITP